jgi:hypothetical protein
MALYMDGKLSSEDMGQLEQDRRELGINRDKAEFIISQVQQREQMSRKNQQEGRS